MTPFAVKYYIVRQSRAEQRVVENNRASIPRCKKYNNKKSPSRTRRYGIWYCQSDDGNGHKSCCRAGKVDGRLKSLVGVVSLVCLQRRGLASAAGKSELDGSRAVGRRCREQAAQYIQHCKEVATYRAYSGWLQWIQCSSRAIAGLLNQLSLHQDCGHAPVKEKTHQHIRDLGGRGELVSCG